MNWQILLTSTLVATVISSTVSALVTIYLKSREYSYDYRKYILEKRKEVYTDIEKMLNILQTFATVQPSYPSTGVKIPYFFISKSDHPVHEFNKQVNNIRVRGFWLSQNMNTEIIMLNRLITRLRVEIPFEEDRDKRIEIGDKYKDEIGAFGKKMASIYFEDIISLDDIKSFKRKVLYK